MACQKNLSVPWVVLLVRRNTSEFVSRFKTMLHRRVNTFGIAGLLNILKTVKAMLLHVQWNGFWFYCLLSHSFRYIWLESLKLLNSQNAKL